MGRKLIRRLPVEKESGASTRKRLLAIVLLQHVLLWSSVYVVASTAYLIHTGAITKELIPVAAVLLFAGSSTLIYIILCNATAWRSTKPSVRSFMTSSACLQMLSKNVLRLVVTAWMVASGLVITFTAARQPFCLAVARTSASPAIDIGTQCIVQRASVAASLLAMITSIGLFILLLNTPDPYLVHLFGINKPPPLLPFTLHYKPTNRPMFSEMSFKCRSTSSFSSSSYTLTDPNEDPLYTLYPTRPEKAYGLGIYAPRKSSFTTTSTASFLAPRPSLRTIRSQASLGGLRPLHLHFRSYPSSPLPPVPSYNPDEYKNLPTALHNKKSSNPAPLRNPPPPRRAYTLKRKGSQGTLRVVLRSPSCPLGLENHRSIETHNDKEKETDKNVLARTQSLSAESLSSVYSRSLSGDEPEPTITAPTPTATANTATASRRHQPDQLQAPTDHRHTTSSIVKRDPLNDAKQAYSRPDRRPDPRIGGIRERGGGGGVVIVRQPHMSSRHAASGNALRNYFPGPGQLAARATAAAGGEVRSGRLPATRAVSGFGDVRDWSGGSDGAAAIHGHGHGGSWAARCNLPPLPVEKARFGGT